MTAIYKIRNLVNGKFYVGSSVDTRVRFQAHRRGLRKGNHHCQPLQRAWAKYGEDCFKFEVVEKVAAACDLYAAENRWLDEHHGQEYCYNVGTRAGASFMGRTHTSEARTKMSDVNKGNRHRLGHTNSTEHRARQSAGMKGIKKSPEHADKTRQRMLGNSCAKGRIVTEEERATRGRAVAEVTSGLEFISVVSAALHFDLQRANVIRALRTDAPLKRGPKKGLHFQYASTLPPSSQ